MYPPQPTTPAPPAPPAQPPAGSSLSDVEYGGLLSLLKPSNDTTVTMLYRASENENATTYTYLLDRVANEKDLAIVIRQDKYVFGVYISEGIQTPANPYESRKYQCEVFWFSLSGRYKEPTRIDIPWRVTCDVAGRNGTVRVGRHRSAARMYVGGLFLADVGSSRPAADIRECSQKTRWDWLPEGYEGATEDYVSERNGGLPLGGSEFFVADDIEVLQVSGEIADILPPLPTTPQPSTSPPPPPTTSTPEPNNSNPGADNDNRTPYDNNTRAD
ncbi:unnamed protein product [Vitrella brassicaformis CCMP3155]|uniref:Uncharacterized protein n=1 Tax=Vitrella brassicaformis (strain CCMP3155) TaxID=1169540 RepID=A0A0G4GRT5_VITBC|nr:unnamed protein product [Vitrella brassicaformis CCMP3155]|eukprot:CEM33066.1 unnamed protein product [Vitrella brassicaformis CCMP3155]